MTEHKHSDNCLMCAVRALTEGIPPLWRPEEVGESVGGVVLKIGEKDDPVIGKVPFVDLWRGGQNRVRFLAFGMSARAALRSAAPAVGDTLTVWYDGAKPIPSGRLKGQPYKAFSVNVQRGHGEA